MQRSCSPTGGTYPDVVVGMVVLAWLTSLPNAFTAFRLGLAGRGDALVSEALHSNSINMVGGLVIPALFVTITGVSAAGLALLFALTALTLAPLARSGGLGRQAGAAIVLAYVAAAADPRRDRGLTQVTAAPCSASVTSALVIGCENIG